MRYKCFLCQIINKLSKLDITACSQFPAVHIIVCVTTKAKIWIVQNIVSGSDLLSHRVVIISCFCYSKLLDVSQHNVSGIPWVSEPYTVLGYAIYLGFLSR